MSPDSRKVASLMNSSSSYKRRSTQSSQAKKIKDPKESDKNIGKDGDMNSKKSNPDKILDSIIQSRCLTKDRDMVETEKDKINSCKMNKFKKLASKDDYGDAQVMTHQNYSRKGSRIRKSLSSSAQKREKL